MHTKIVEQIIEFSLKVIDVSLSEKNLSQINREKDRNITKNKRSNIFISVYTKFRGSLFNCCNRLLADPRFQQHVSTIERANNEIGNARLHIVTFNFQSLARDYSMHEDAIIVDDDSFSIP